VSTPKPVSRRKLPLPILIGGKVCLAAVLLWLVLAKVNITEAIQRLTHARPIPTAIAVAIALVIPNILALRWWVLARPMIAFSDAITYTWIGSFYALILPGAVSGDVAKGGLLAWRDAKARQAALPASILADRLVGLAVMLLFFSLSSLFVVNTGASPELKGFALPAAGVGVLALFAMVLACTTRCQHLLLAALARVPWEVLRNNTHRFAEATFAFTGQPKRLLRAAALSVVSQGLCVGMYVALLAALSTSLGLVPAFALYSIIAVLGLAPITFAGIGLRDWFAVAFFSAYHLPAEAGVAFAWLCLAMSVLQALVGGLWQLATVFVRRPPSVTDS
jgi:glycosyltransferase 2 family protein